VTTGAARVSLLRYSPALILFAIVIADARQHSDPDLWGHVLFGRQLLAHGSLPRDNPYSYSAPTFPWLHHEWLSEVLMGALFDKFGTAGLKLLKFACTAGTISLIALAEAETIAPALVQLSILLAAALLLMPVMQFRPQLFDFLLLSAIIALLARHHRRGSGMLWVAIPLIAVWSNLHGGFFYRPGCDRSLWRRDHARRSLVGAPSQAWCWNSCDDGGRGCVHSHHISDPACARYLGHAYQVDSESDDALYDWRLDTADTLAHRCASQQRRAEIFRARAFVFRRRVYFSCVEAERR